MAKLQQNEDGAEWEAELEEKYPELLGPDAVPNPTIPREWLETGRITPLGEQALEDPPPA